MLPGTSIHLANISSNMLSYGHPLRTGLTATDKTEACADTSLGIFLTVLSVDDWMGHCWAKGHTFARTNPPNNYTVSQDLNCIHMPCGPEIVSV